MTDLNSLEQAAQTAISGAATKEGNKAMAWLKANSGPFLIGFGSCAFLWFVVHRYL
jgi:hypothetical protein